MDKKSKLKYSLIFIISFFVFFILTFITLFIGNHSWRGDFWAERITISNMPSKLPFMFIFTLILSSVYTFLLFIAGDKD